MSSDESTTAEAVDEVIGELDEEEISCEEVAVEVIEGDGQPEDFEISPEEEAEIDGWLEESEEGLGAAPRGLGPAGGGWGGAASPGKRAMRIGKRNGLTVTSKKRSILSKTSDHHVSQKRAFAADLSNGSSPTPQMDRTARQIAKRLGHPEFRGGVLSVTTNGYRVQLLYKTHVGGNHFNHVHVGIRML